MSDINLNLFYFINHSLQNPFFDWLMPILTHFGGFISLLIVLIVLIIYSWFKKYLTFRNILILTLFAFLFCDIITVFLKNFVHEPRPFVSFSNVHLLINESDPNSFPSGHTCSTLSVIAVLVLNMKKLSKNHYKIISTFLIVFALIIGFSRIYVGVHYPADVLAGGIIGIVGALLIVKLNEVLSIINI